MLSTALVTLVLLFALQALLVVKVADKLTAGAVASQDGRNGKLQDAGRYTQLAA
ncbi:hypothetical protein [Methylobacterium gnaphalii]|uniref:Uncharacterized protein n=1 Tax=Methylobacterium gnaphalii TaxID=1010610 RepID=A0A512JDX9_9HYPH|nr:hypothetical protein [Methylobacterium gnaphalii]GEP08163.1 hypothetical protein MGN01_00080 [Methylobacterium gnaphalii]GJD68240.1 hypothetical protein MMMDOFMJ_1159 [Methylobacterium gnaphalii]GLS51206.1 hypothetical protein GCM10007885_40600 [Methylobacterium gnaphalii]